MARQEELTIRIDPAGKVRVEVKGLPGAACMEYVELFRQVLGPVEQQETTAEFYQAEVQTELHVRSNSG